MARGRKGSSGRIAKRTEPGYFGSCPVAGTPPRRCEAPGPDQADPNFDEHLPPDRSHVTLRPMLLR